MCNQNPISEEVAEVVEKFDPTGADQFSLDTWLKICEGPSFKDYMRDEQLIEAFRQFDKDGTGMIATKQVRYMLQHIGDATLSKEFHLYCTE